MLSHTRMGVPYEYTHMGRPIHVWDNIRILLLLLLLLAWIQKNRNKQFDRLGQRPLKVSTSSHLPIIIETIFEGIGRISINHILG